MKSNYRPNNLTFSTNCGILIKSERIKQGGEIVGGIKPTKKRIKLRGFWHRKPQTQIVPNQKAKDQKNKCREPIKL